MTSWPANTATLNIASTSRNCRRSQRKWVFPMLNEHDRALDALQAIPSDLPREQWVKAGMGFHAAGGTFEAFDAWSATASNYKELDSRSTWRSFKSFPGGIGTGTLYAMAKDHGWIESQPYPPVDRIARTSAPSSHQAPNVEAPEVVYARCDKATNAHPYIVAKRAAGVELDKLRVVPAGDTLTIMGYSMVGALVVPCYAPDGALSTLQFIPVGDVADRLKSVGKSNKLNLKGAPVHGWHMVGHPAEGAPIYITEGIGQAWACWQATGAAAVSCFGSGNVGKVAKALRQSDNTALLVLVPDVGKESDAVNIAAEVGAAVAAMPDGWEKNSDVNDLMKRDGLDVLTLLLESATEPPKPPPLLKPVSVFDVLTNPAPPPAFIWDGYLPRGVVALMGAHGGTGKSTIALMLGVCTALGRSLFGVDTEQSTVLFVSLEDGVHIVRHRLAGICRTWEIDPALLNERLHIVDGTEHPELFSAETRGSGEKTATYQELCELVQSENIGLVIVDNASDAFGGDEIQRRQVRAFMRALVEVARLTDCAVLLLAHVDKATSRSKKPEGGEGYSGSTAWHNSSRSRLFMTRGDDGLLTLEHQKSNLGKMREPIVLAWPDSGLPTLASDVPDIYGTNNLQQGRADDARVPALLGLIAEFESRGDYCSPSPQARTNVFSVLKSEPAFQKLKLNSNSTRRIVTQCQRAKWIAVLEYRNIERKPRQRWTVTTEGRLFARLPAPSAPTAPTSYDGAQSANGKDGGAPTAPTYVGGMGDRARTDDGATASDHDYESSIKLLPQATALAHHLFDTHSPSRDLNQGYSQ